MCFLFFGGSIFSRRGECSASRLFQTPSTSTLPWSSNHTTCLVFSFYSGVYVTPDHETLECCCCDSAFTWRHWLPCCLLTPPKWVLMFFSGKTTCLWQRWLTNRTKRQQPGFYSASPGWLHLAWLEISGRSSPQKAIFWWRWPRVRLPSSSQSPAFSKQSATFTHRATVSTALQFFARKFQEKGTVLELSKGKIFARMPWFRPLTGRILVKKCWLCCHCSHRTALGKETKSGILLKECTGFFTSSRRRTFL